MTETDLIGTWQLASYEVRGANGALVRPFGEEPIGFLTYTADGYMSGQLGRAARTPIAGDDWESATDAEIAAAGRHFFAYCGTFRVRSNTVTHRVDLSLLPNWIGSEQMRFAELVGDELTLSASFPGDDGLPQTAALRWRRLKAAKG